MLRPGVSFGLVVGLVAFITLASRSHGDYREVGRPAGGWAAPADTVRVDTLVVEAPFLHVVRKGDTLFNIAQRYDLSVEELQRVNGLTGTNINLGQGLVVDRATPRWSTRHVVGPGDTLYNIARRYGLNVAQLQFINALTGDRIEQGQSLAVPRRIDVDEAEPTPVADTGRTDTSTVTVGEPPVVPEQEQEQEQEPVAVQPPPEPADSAAAPVTGPEQGPPTDTTTVAQERPLPPRVVPDSLGADSLLAIVPDSTVTDSVGADSALAYVWADTGRVGRYLQPFGRDFYTARLVPRKRRPLSTRLGSYWRHEIKLDSTGQAYIAREFVGQQDVRYPLVLDLPTYRDERLRLDAVENFRRLALQRAQQQRQQQRRGFGVNIVVPGGRESAFSTIFGAPSVDLRVNGQANINAGFAYQQSDQQISLRGKKGQLDPDFEQNIRLSITGSIGDKLRVDVNWDTERTFDFQNQLKLEYTGYEDEIVQKVVAGNVFLQTPSQLIQGGQSLFGIRTDLQLGGIKLTTVASQQEGEAEEINLEGGSQTTEFELKPTDYEDNQHFFLAYFFRNWWNRAFRDPQQPTVLSGYDRISDIEVWRLERTTTGKNDPNVREAVALVDLGEQPFFSKFPDSTLLELPGTNPLDYRYSQADFSRLRTDNSIIDFLTGKGLQQTDFQVGDFRKLQEGRDYDVDELLGFISLRNSLTDGEALAIAYKFPAVAAPDGISEVGDFASETSGRLILKLLRKANHNPNTSTWGLTMRNIYNMRGRGFSPTEFELDIVFERPGQPATRTLPGQRTTLLQLLGLDRLSQDGRPTPDNRFDFESWLIDPSSGRLYFPFLQPFSAQISTATDNDQFIFSNLYTQKKAEAIRDSQHDVYRIRGSYKSSVQSVYNIPSFGIVEGSVVVTSGGAQLQSGSDYIVDYSTGTVTITNQAYLAPGRDIRITYERSQFAAIQKKTLLGMRADYEFGDNLALGATMLRLSEKPLIDKYRVGEEPLKNMIWGVDGSYSLEPRWLTRAIDALPFIQTKERSSIKLQGEFAQLVPGSPQTLAFKRTRDQLRKKGFDFKDDELDGISYIDDFESVENSISLKQQGAWNLSSVPDSVAAEATAAISFNDSLRTTYRAGMGWYVMPLTPERVFDFSGQPGDNIDAVRSMHVNEVYPNRDVSAESAAGQRLQTFDVFFDPTDRGPYNYAADFDRFRELNERKKLWGGMMQRLPEGYTDFNLNNIEFIEFIFSPYSRAPGGDAGEDAKLLIDIGSISEDVVPNERLNTEDGLSLSAIDRADSDDWSRLSSGIQDAIVKVDETTGRTEDLGFDGYPSKAPTTGGEPYERSETEAFATLLESARQSLGSDDPLYLRLERDPSGDDYYHYLDDAYWNDRSLFPETPLIQQRYSRFFAGLELNTFEGQREIRGNGNPIVGNSNIPDTEDLNANANLDTDNSYFQYAIPLSRAKLDELAAPNATDDFVVNRIQGVDPQTGLQSVWYTVRIPVRDPRKRVVGGIQDFTLIRSMRLWTTGHVAPATIRFATLELVGSQWQKSRQVGCPFLSSAECQNRDIGSLISISTINNEESQGYQIPEGAIRSKLRLATGIQEAREQALVLKARDLQPGDTRAVFKPFTQALNMLKYGNMRMFVHGHGDGFEQRGDVRLFIRLGLNENNDYYEYEAPITPSDPFASSDEVWQTNIDTGGGERIDLNSVNIELSAFNKLKVERDDSLGFPKTREFIRTGYDFAPPGTNLKIKGNPSLSGITTMVMGLRTDSLSNRVVNEVDIWLNELRVTEFDSEKGWAALATAQIQLADLARIDANIRTQTDGFGPLASELGNREADNVLNWSLTTNFNLHKFIPERFGWNIPLTYSIRENQSTPRFSPDRGDIRLVELLEEVDEDQGLDAAERQTKKDDILAKSQVNQTTRSFSVPVSKRGSKSPWLRNTIDGLTVNYSQSTSEGSNPSTLFNNSEQWSSSASYRFQARIPRTFRPLWFIGGLPVLGFLGELRMAYIPQSLQFSASANRNFSESQERNRTPILEGDPAADSLRFEALARYPVRENHAFAHARTFQLNYNPFTFLQLGYQNNIAQSLREMSEDTLFSVAWYDTATSALTVLDNITRDDALDRGLVDETAIELSRLALMPAGDVFSRIVSGTGEVRTERYGENYTATIDPKISPSVQWLRWFTPQPLSYTGRFQWQNGPAGKRKTGAGVQNNVSLRSGLRLALQDFWRQFGFYQSLEKAERDATNAKRAAGARKTQQKAARKEIMGRYKNARRVIRDQVDSLKSVARTEIDSVLKMDRAARDSLTGVQRARIDTLLLAKRAEGDSLGIFVDSLKAAGLPWDDQEPALELQLKRSREDLDAYRAREDVALKRRIGAMAREIDSLRALPTREQDSTLALTLPQRDSLVAGREARHDSLAALVDTALDSVVASVVVQVDSLQGRLLRGREADSLRTAAERNAAARLERVEAESEEMDRLIRKGKLEELLVFTHPVLADADSIASIADSLAKARSGYDQLRTPARQEEDAGGPLAFLNPTGFLRKLALAVTGVRDLSFTYSGSWTGASSNVSDETYSLFEAFQGQGPSLRYRVGLDRVIDPNLNRRLIADSTLRVTDRLSENTQLGARTSISLTQTLRVDVTWDTKWDDREDLSYQLGPERSIVTTRTLSGTNQASIWAFGADYLRFFNSQLETFRADRAAGEGGPLGDANGDGRIVLTNEALVQDFQASFIRKVSQFGSNALLPFPLPNWNLNWTGLNSLPIFRALAQSATLRHGYSATYDADYRSNAAAGSQKSRNLKTLRGDGSGTVVSQEIVYDMPEREVGSVRVNSRWQPLLGVDVTWKGGIQTGLTMNRTASYALSATSADVTTNETSELQMRINWSLRGIRLPFIKRGRLNNTLRIGLTVSQSQNTELRYRLQPDIETFLSENVGGLTVDEFRASLPPDAEFLNPPPVASTRTNLEPQISYTFSNRVSADFFVTYENLQSEGSRVPNSTNVRGGFRVRVSIAN